MKLTLRIAAATLLLSAILLFLAGATAAERALHPARKKVAALCPCIVHAQCRDAIVTAPDGTTLRGWYFAPDTPNGGAVISLHGIGGTREDMVAVGAVFLRAGYAVLEPDLRGHGESEGITTYGVNEQQDVHTWADWMLHQPHIARIYGFGVSLGGSVLLGSLNLERRFGSVVAESSYSDFREIANERMRHAMPAGTQWLAGSLVEAGLVWARFRYSVNLDGASPLFAVRQTRIPVLLIHGLADEKTSPENSQRLAAADPADTQLWLVPNEGHAGAWHATGKQFEARVVQWFDRH